MEAMGCKKTVLASDVKGHSDLIEEGVTGYLSPRMMLPFLQERL
jgi:hypothetical protein